MKTSNVGIIVSMGLFLLFSGLELLFGFGVADTVVGSLLLIIGLAVGMAVYLKGNQ